MDKPRCPSFEKCDILGPSECSNNTSFQLDISVLSGLSDYVQEHIELQQLICPLSDISKCVFNSLITGNDNILNGVPSDVFMGYETVLTDADHIRTQLVPRRDICDDEKTVQQEKSKLFNNLLVKNNKKLKLDGYIETQYNFSQITKLLHQLSKTENDKENLMQDNNNLRVTISKIKVENQAKQIIINNLKEKVSKQYVQINNETKNKTQLINILKNKNLDASHIKKEKQWYQEQLYLAQREKEHLNEKVYRQISTIKLQSKEILRLNLELNKLRIDRENIQLNSLIQKEKLFKRVQLLNESDLNDGNYEIPISKLNENLSDILLWVKQLTNENHESSLKMQKDIKEKHSTIQELQHVLQKLEMNIQILNKQHSKELQQFLELKNKVHKLHSELFISYRSEKLSDLNKQCNVFSDHILQAINELNEITLYIKDLSQNSVKQEHKSELNSNLTCIKEQMIFEKNKSEKSEIQFNDICKDTVLKNLEAQQKIKDLNEQNRKLENDIFLKNFIINKAIEKHHVLETKIDGIYKENSCTNKLETEKTIPSQTKIKTYNYDNRDCNMNMEDSSIKIESEAASSVVIVHSTKNNPRLIKSLLPKIKDLYGTLKIFNRKLVRNDEVLKNILFILSQRKQDDVKDLKVLLKVKELEMREKQKKYEISIRILLQKIKDYMKERNSAEKKYSYIQAHCNVLSNENNSLKYELTSFKSELANVNKECQNCLDYPVMTKKINLMENEIDEYHDDENTSKLLRISLQQKTDDLKILEDNKLQIINLSKNNNGGDDDKIIMSKIHLQALQNELSLTKADKIFLQRLCKDLRMALHSYVDCNKVLKSQVEQIKMKNKSQRPSSINLININSDITFDEEHVNMLLSECNDFRKSNPVADLRTCLDDFKLQVIHLQTKVENF